MLNTAMLDDVAYLHGATFWLGAPGMKLNNITDISVSNIVTEAKHQCMRKVMESTGLELVAFLN